MTARARGAFEGPLRDALTPRGRLTVTEVAGGAEALVVAEAARARFAAGVDAPALVLHVARDGAGMEALRAGLAFVAPEVEAVVFPAWDAQPYDRASPNAAVVAARMGALSRLARTRGGERPRVVLTTANALVQRVPPIDWVRRQSLAAAPGNAIAMGGLVEWLESNGYQRAGTVRDAGEYAVRGGILDLYPAQLPGPVRLDFFGDTLESIRAFDPETQRTTGRAPPLELVPMSEVQLTSDAIRRFRGAYVAAFGAVVRADPLYEAVSEGRRYPGLEHWAPLFHEGMSTLVDFVPGARPVFDAQAPGAIKERLTAVADYFDARSSALRQPGTAAGAVYKPLPPDALYLKPEEAEGLLAGEDALHLSPFAAPEGAAGARVSLGARPGRSFAPEREATEGSVFDAAVAHVEALARDGRRVVIAAWSEGSRERLGTVLGDHGLKGAKPVGSLRALAPGAVGLAVLPLEAGFEAGDLAVVGEQDVLGERLSRGRKAKRAANFIAEAGSLQAGDLVVHVDHGIGRFVGLQVVDAAGAPQDCLEIHYADNNRLFLPVANVELLSRYGGEGSDAQLDRLGGGGWQARKARMKKRVLDMAKGLLALAAKRLTREAPRLAAPPGLYDEFAARFPYDETEDQQAAIDAVLDDLASGRPMDRLVCGDVGFGKTEVALRAAFVAAMNGKQVAVVVPTTLLARQHHRTFAERFAGLPLKVRQLSRMVASGDLREAKAGLADGTVDIVVGTHALLSKTVSFKDLGLVIVDEEQHFGVAHKERLKALRAEVHVLTLSATPIPRTLQLALTGVRELSLITTPPVDRLAVRTFVTPFDDLAVREALLRERYRGGQTFYVCPRIEDLSEARQFLERSVPEVKVVTGHGQMAATQLEEVMSAFYEGQYDVLLSTTIVESGLDIPRANTLIVHRADRFGLSQLYQLRGRVGRAKTRAYALFTVPANQELTPQAERRLKVLQGLEGLGAGFQLASHDLDIRGAGNLLGDEQSGHIREVGVELYQQMLQDAVEALKAGVEEPAEEAWSPTIQVGTPVLIPEDYVADLDARLALYRRLAAIGTQGELDAVGAEMVDRFGEPPLEIGQLLELVAIKLLSRRANVEKVDAGPKGIVVAFRDNAFADPGALVRYVAKQGASAKVRPDMRVAFMGDFDAPAARLKAARKLVGDLARLAERRAA